MQVQVQPEKLVNSITVKFTDTEAIGIIKGYSWYIDTLQKELEKALPDLWSGPYNTTNE